MNSKHQHGGVEIGFIGFGILLLFLLLGGIGGYMYVSPHYSVWSSQKAGEAKYAEAESTRRVTVLEAQAKFDSAKLLADAEVARARGVAQANQIIGDSLQGNELYLHYLWIQNLHEGRNDVIYVPTEAGIPLMEAGRAMAPHRMPESPAH